MSIKRLYRAGKTGEAHYTNMPMQYAAILIFLIFFLFLLQNIDCG